MAISPNPRRPELLFSSTLRTCALVLGAAGLLPMVEAATTRSAARAAIPAQAQVIDQRTFNVLSYVPPSTSFNGTSGPFVPPGHSLDSLMERPFHVYDDDFLQVLGTNPTLTLIGQTASDPIFHEAVVWTPGTDEVFFVENAGSPASGTGLNKSAIISKISLADAAKAQAAKLAGSSNSTLVPVTTVPSTPQVINPNGATNYRGQIVFAGEGQGADVTSSLYLMNPKAPYNTSILINNYFGRQFSSLNDVAVHPVSRDLYFTDTLYGYLQDFRPAPGLPNQVYRFVEATGALTVAADGFVLPNGLAFSPDGAYAYVSDTGMQHALYGKKYSDPATIYRYDVKKDGTFENRKTFAYADSSVPDGVHCDSKGNVYAGCGDGVQVWSPSGKLLGKIFLGSGTANFQFTGKGRMVVCAETKLYYVTLAVEGAIVPSEM